jgi:hypothetical protein
MLTRGSANHIESNDDQLCLSTRYKEATNILAMTEPLQDQRSNEKLDLAFLTLKCVEKNYFCAQELLSKSCRGFLIVMVRTLASHKKN